MQFLVHILVTSVLLFVIGRVIDGIDVRDGKAALFGALALGVANALVRPIVVFFTLPVTVVTLGLFLLVVNALMLMLAAVLVDGFEVDGFGAALKGSVALAVLNLLVGVFVG